MFQGIDGISLSAATAAIGHKDNAEKSLELMAFAEVHLEALEASGRLYHETIYSSKAFERRMVPAVVHTQGAMTEPCQGDTWIETAPVYRIGRSATKKSTWLPQTPTSTEFVGADVTWARVQFPRLAIDNHEIQGNSITPAHGWK